MTPTYKRQYPPVCPKNGHSLTLGCFTSGCRLNQRVEKVYMCVHPEADWPSQEPLVRKPRMIWMQESLFWLKEEG